MDGWEPLEQHFWHDQLLELSTGSMESLVSPVQLRWNSCEQVQHLALLTPLHIARGHLSHLPLGRSSDWELTDGSISPVHSWHSHFPFLRSFVTFHLSIPEHEAWAPPEQSLHMSGDMLALNLFLQIKHGPSADWGVGLMLWGCGHSPPCSWHLQVFPARCSSLLSPLHCCCLCTRTTHDSSLQVMGRYCGLKTPLQVIHLGLGGGQVLSSTTKFGSSISDSFSVSAPGTCSDVGAGVLPTCLVGVFMHSITSLA